MDKILCYQVCFSHKKILEHLVMKISTVTELKNHLYSLNTVS